MHQGSLRRVSKERRSDLASPHSFRFGPLRLVRSPFRAKRAFELVIPRGLSKQFFDGWRRVVLGERIDTDEPLLRVHFVTGSQLQPRNALSVYSDEMKAI